jgi:hypothetical protein
VQVTGNRLAAVAVAIFLAGRRCGEHKDKREEASGHLSFLEAG